MYEKEQAKVMEYVYQLLETMTLEEDGTVSHPIRSGFDMRVRILVSKICIPGLQDRIALAQRLITDSLRVFKREGMESPQWQDFADRLSNVVGDYWNMPLIDYCIVFPLHACGPWIARKRWFNVLGMRFRRVTWQRVRAMRGWREFSSHARAQLALQDRQDDLSTVMDFCPLLVTLPARTSSEAFELAGRDFELLRALINLISDYGRVHRQFGVARPLAQTLSPPIHGVFRSNGDYEDLYYSIEHYDYWTRRFEFSRDIDRLAQKWLTRIVGLSGEMRMS